VPATIATARLALASTRNASIAGSWNPKCRAPKTVPRQHIIGDRYADRGVDVARGIDQRQGLIGFVAVKPRRDGDEDQENADVQDPSSCLV
jgi:hypothetical protein